jgi:hypothetical protein
MRDTLVRALGVLLGASLVSPLHAQQATSPEPPRVLLDTRMPRVQGRTLNVGPQGNLQAALESARPGDEIVLQAGATYTGSFILPLKAGASRMPGTGPVIIVRSSGLANLREGHRVSPGDTLMLARLVAPRNGAEALGTVAGTAGWRLSGLEITAAPSVSLTGRLVRFGDGSRAQNNLASVPQNIVLDRSYVHAGSKLDIRRCIDLQSGATAIIDSYVSGCHANGADAQAIAGWNGPGPYKITNNYLEASTENISFGGADPGILNLVPSDIEIRGNYLTKPVAWKGVWLGKNLFELKTGQRVLVEGNVFENNWQDGQGGSAIVLKSTNQDGGCPWCGTRDVIFRLNLIRNTGAGFALSAAPDPHHTDFPLQRVSITDNIVTNVDVPPTFNGDGRGLLINQDVVDLVIAHNTLLSPTNAAVLFGGPLDKPPVRLIIRDNLIGGGAYGVKGPGLTGGSATVSAFMRDGAFAGNVVILPSAAGYPAGNYYPSTTSGLGFVNAAQSDFHLTPTSPLRKKGSDGRDIGADVDAVMAAINGVVP